jgi:hypothetical protein
MPTRPAPSRRGPRDSLQLPGEADLKPTHSPQTLQLYIGDGGGKVPHRRLGVFAPNRIAAVAA